MAATVITHIDAQHHRQYTDDGGDGGDEFETCFVQRLADQVESLVIRERTSPWVVVS